MASLEDTFRMMNGEEPVNTNRLTAEDKNFSENRSKYNNAGSGGGKITKDFMNCVTETLIETRGGVVESKGTADIKDVKKYRDGLVDAGKKIVAGLSAIKLDHPDKAHDLNMLNDIENDMQNLINHLQMFPELRSYVRGKISIPTRPKRKRSM
jgi:hypothetical protein